MLNERGLILEVAIRPAVPAASTNTRHVSQLTASARAETLLGCRPARIPRATLELGVSWPLVQAGGAPQLRVPSLRHANMACAARLAASPRDSRPAECARPGTRHSCLACTLPSQPFPHSLAAPRHLLCSVQVQRMMHPRSGSLPFSPERGAAPGQEAVTKRCRGAVPPRRGVPGRRTPGGGGGPHHQGLASRYFLRPPPQPHPLPPPSPPPSPIGPSCLLAACCLPRLPLIQSLKLFF